MAVACITCILLPYCALLTIDKTSAVNVSPTVQLETAEFAPQLWFVEVNGVLRWVPVLGKHYQAFLTPGEVSYSICFSAFSSSRY